MTNAAQRRLKAYLAPGNPDLLIDMRHVAKREIGFPRGPKKPKRGTWRLPVSALLIFAVAALFSASGGTHRVRGVMAAVCVLSPVESTSPPQLSNYNSLLRLCGTFGKRAFANSTTGKFRGVSEQTATYTSGGSEKCSRPT